MTPRQEAALRKRIAKLKVQETRALAPAQKRRSAVMRWHGKEIVKAHKAFDARRAKLSKQLDKKIAPHDKRIAAIEKRFDKKIGMLMRKL